MRWSKESYFGEIWDCGEREALKFELGEIEDRIASLEERLSTLEAIVEDLEVKIYSALEKLKKLEGELP